MLHDGIYRATSLLYADLPQTFPAPMPAIRICRGQLKGSFMEPRRQFGEQHFSVQRQVSGKHFEKIIVGFGHLCIVPSYG
jgi:hypothetical protein